MWALTVRDPEIGPLRYPLRNELRGAGWSCILMVRLAFNHSTSREAEQEYDRLRDLASEAAKKRASCFEKVACSALGEEAGQG
jgi:hypothetical protein